MTEIILGSLAEKIKWYLRDKSGATAIEYGLIAALIGIATIGGLKTLAGDSSSMWGEIESKVNNEI